MAVIEAGFRTPCVCIAMIDSCARSDGSPVATWSIAHLELREPPLDGSFGASLHPPIAPHIRNAFKSVLLLNSDYDLARAKAALAAGTADAITFGRPYIVNPELPRRLADSIPLPVDDMETWFTQGSKGYNDYPHAA